eukprot:Transcript_2624.p1 GENE.Transcript_2624~~Transcript_2624.p1  ORF type:complete len:327 (+),score=143.60 Transcript_2624:280-1260(+)
MAEEAPPEPTGAPMGEKKISFSGAAAEGQTNPAMRRTLSRSNTTSLRKEDKKEAKTSGVEQHIRADVTYDHAGPVVPQDDAHLIAQRIGEGPVGSVAAPQLKRTLTKQLTRKISMGAGLKGEETPEETERIRRKSVFLQSQVIYKTEEDKNGQQREVGDMKKGLRDVALDVASEAVVRGGWDNEIAAFIKKRMERRQQSITGGKWHCIVGPDFGSYVTHEKGYFCYFYLPRNLSPIEALEKARRERKERGSRMEEQAASGGGKSTEDILEAKLEKELAKKASAAGFSENSLELNDDRPMFDPDRVGNTFGKGEDEKRMVGILIWRT